MSKFKKVASQGVNPSIEPQNLNKYASVTGNLYETLVVLSRRSKQLGIEEKEELHSKLDEFASTTDSMEEVHENREQIEISRFYERLPHPTLIAQQEMFDGEIYFNNPYNNPEE